MDFSTASFICRMGSAFSFCLSIVFHVVGQEDNAVFYALLAIVFALWAIYDKMQEHINDK